MTATGNVSESSSLGSPHPSAGLEPAPPPVPHHHEVLTMLQTTMTFLVGALFVLTFIVQPYRIPTPSMENTLLVGDFLLVNKVVFGPPGPWRRLLPYQPIRRDDIVVFHYPVDPSVHVVKRVIAVPGDRIRLHRGFVRIDGALEKEPFALYLPSYPSNFRDEFPTPTYTDAGVSTAWWNQLRQDVHDGALQVPPGEYFVLGDNRNDSLDSRYWGFVPRANIVGQPFLVYFSLTSPDGSELPRPVPAGPPGPSASTRSSSAEPATSASPSSASPSNVRLAGNAPPSGPRWWTTLASSARWDRIFHVIR